MAQPEQEAGYEWEADVASRLGYQAVPGSGSQWYAKGDVQGTNVIISAKATKEKSYSLSTVEWSEIFNIAHRPGGLGADFVPLMAIRLLSLSDEPKDLIVMDFDTFKQMAAGELPPLVQESKADVKTRLAHTTILDR